MKCFPWREWVWVVPLLVALTGLYVAAYYANARATIVIDNDKTAREEPYLDGFLASPWGRVIFAPMHAMDRAVRPEFWNRLRGDTPRLQVKSRAGQLEQLAHDFYRFRSQRLPCDAGHLVAQSRP